MVSKYSVKYPTMAITGKIPIFYQIKFIIASKLYHAPYLLTGNQSQYRICGTIRKVVLSPANWQ